MIEGNPSVPLAERAVARVMYEALVAPARGIEIVRGVCDATSTVASLPAIVIDAVVSGAITARNRHTRITHDAAAGATITWCDNNKPK
jgi:hypothetical protein